MPRSPLPRAASAPHGRTLDERSAGYPAGGHDFAETRVHAGGSAGIQPKLVVGAVGDKYEQEADRAAEQVVRLRAAYVGQAAPSAVPWPSTVQRQALVSPSPEDGTVVPRDETDAGRAVEPDSEQAAAVQPLRARDRGDGGRRGAPPSGWEWRLASTLSAGRPLPDDARHELERGFGADFEGVRVHSDPEAARLSAAIGARAFTHRAHIYFGDGEYAPGADVGRRVLAHELAHVIQQGAAERGEPRPPVSEAPGPGPTAPPIQRLSRLNRSDPANVVRTNYAPWPNTTDPRGDEYRVTTGAGSVVTAWVAYSGYAESQRYWCHGHSLGTYATDGYSVYSGDPVMGAINDEWRPIADKDTQPDDITVALPTFDHSALFTDVVLSGNTMDENATKLSTKNGMNPLANASLFQVKAAYPGRTFRSFRRKT